ncbi:amidase [Thalassotalea euphylliae]|uniref:Amidase n=1 Tax=Thalassotalea euphylliae TaxID=1655234 RepID=A0A3E0UIU4_9GAMM|nr:amidase [Thalassotalea euphylliae]REL36861.1 amidase [Thalassotalea euphylliae]
MISLFHSVKRFSLKPIAVSLVVLSNLALAEAPNSLDLATFTEHATIPELHQKMQSGELTSEALVRFYLARIEVIDDSGPTINSVVQLNANAVAQAKAYDLSVKTEGLKGVLHGIPVLLKDNIDTTDGMANTAGSIALAKNFPAQDAFLVSQLKRAGAIILGKTNLSEWANFRSDKSTSGWTSLYGQTKNPYDLTRNPCGSSSGSGAAIAANLATVAIGTETDGSITCPAAINGLVGIKPTIGTVSRHGIIPIAFSQDTAGPMARNLTDAVITLSALSAFDEQDPAPTKANYQASNGRVVQPTALSSALKTDGLKGKRIGVLRQLSGYHRDVDQLLAEAIEQLQQQGAIIVDDLAFDDGVSWGAQEYEVLLYEFKEGINKYLAGTDKSLPKTLAELIAYNELHSDRAMPYFGQEIFISAQSKGDLTDKVYLDALAHAKKMSQSQGIDKLLGDHQLDLLIAPTTGPAWKTDLINGDNFSGSATSPAAVSGYPHITLPMGYVSGLPVGLSMFSTQLTEPVLIEAAFAYEQVTKHRQPPKFLSN